MDIKQRIHIFGASGSGTTTLGSALAKELSIPHLDTDEYYWKKTEIPYTEKYSPEERIQSIRKTISNHKSWVLSGSLCSWGAPITGLFTLTIFVYLSSSLRLQRLREREFERYGTRIEESGDMREKHIQFMEWAAKYDTASPPTRSMKMHREWGAKLSCPVIEINSEEPLDKMVRYAVQKLPA